MNYKTNNRDKFKVYFLKMINKVELSRKKKREKIQIIHVRNGKENHPPDSTLQG